MGETRDYERHKVFQEKQGILEVIRYCWRNKGLWEIQSIEGVIMYCGRNMEFWET